MQRFALIEVTDKLFNILNTFRFGAWDSPIILAWKYAQCLRMKESVNMKH